MKLTELFDKGRFVVTSEIGPVKGCVRHADSESMATCAREAEDVKGIVDAINVTDNQSAVMRLGSLAASVKLKQMGAEPIYQLTCRDRNRIALQSELLSACSLGIDNVLCLTGDHIALGDHKDAKPVFDIDSVQLLSIARGLNEGVDMAGNALTHSTDLALGAVVNPGFAPLDLQLLKMEKKIEAGAQFFQTQAVYDPKVFEAFVRADRVVSGADPGGDRRSQERGDGSLHEQERLRYHRPRCTHRRNRQRGEGRAEGKSRGDDAAAGARDRADGPGHSLHAAGLVGHRAGGRLGARRAAGGVSVGCRMPDRNPNPRARCRGCPLSGPDPQVEARSMRVVFDAEGRPWLCDIDANVDRTGDLSEQGCWRFPTPSADETDGTR